MSKRGKQDKDGVSRSNQTNAAHNDFDDDVDALFRLPVAEFTAARNTLSSQLKKSGRGDQAAVVKSLAKPSVSAWAVNQLFWNHRDAFDQLIALGERFHKAQTSGKVADMRSALDSRREALTHLSDLAAAVLREAGHNPSPDTIHRITTTLEAISVYATRADAPRPGRLTHDVDPPGFESFGSFVPSAGMAATPEAGSTRQTAGKTKLKTPSEIRSIRKSSSVGTNTRGKVATDEDELQREETRKAKLAAAKVSLQEAKKSLTEARAKAQRLETDQRKADAEAKKAEKHRQNVEEELRRAEAAAERAARRAQSADAEVEEAASKAEEAQHTVEKATKELEKMFRGA